MTFLRPWFLLLLLLPLLILRFGHKGKSFSIWEKVIAPEFLPYLLVRSDTKESRQLQLFKVFLWCALVIGLSGPAWYKIPLPSQNVDPATVIVLELGSTMVGDNLKKAQHKINDILDELEGEQVALVLYDKLGYTAAPLTFDMNIIRDMIPYLEKDVLPRPTDIQTIAGFKKASEILSSAGIDRGRIIFVTGGADIGNAVQQWAKQNQNPVGVLVIGSQEAHPVALPTGGFLKDANGKLVMVKPNLGNLSQLGYTQMMTPDHSDVRNIIAQTPFYTTSSRKDVFEIEVWQDMGGWFVAFTLPFFAFLFRKRLLILFLLFALPTQASLWLRPDQEAYLRQVEGVKDYRAHRFEEAGEAFSSGFNVDDLYNWGNALAFQQKIPEAIDAYRQVLEEKPNHEDARYNKAYLERQLKKKEPDPVPRPDYTPMVWDGKGEDPTLGNDAEEQSQSDNTNLDSSEVQDTSGQNPLASKTENGGQDSQKSSQKTQQGGAQSSQGGDQAKNQQTNQSSSSENQSQSASNPQQNSQPQSSQTDSSNSSQSATQPENNPQQNTQPQSSQTDSSSSSQSATQPENNPQQNSQQQNSQTDSSSSSQSAIQPENNPQQNSQSQSSQAEPMSSFWELSFSEQKQQEQQRLEQEQQQKQDQMTPEQKQQEQQRLEQEQQQKLDQMTPEQKQQEQQRLEQEQQQNQDQMTPEQKQQEQQRLEQEQQQNQDRMTPEQKQQEQQRFEQEQQQNQDQMTPKQKQQEQQRLEQEKQQNQDQMTPEQKQQEQQILEQEKQHNQDQMTPEQKQQEQQRLEQEQQQKQDQMTPEQKQQEQEKEDLKQNQEKKPDENEMTPEQKDEKSEQKPEMKPEEEGKEKEQEVIPPEQEEPQPEDAEEKVPDSSEEQQKEMQEQKELELSLKQVDDKTDQGGKNKEEPAQDIDAAAQEQEETPETEELNDSPFNQEEQQILNQLPETPPSLLKYRLRRQYETKTRG